MFKLKPALAGILACLACCLLPASKLARRTRMAPQTKPSPVPAAPAGAGPDHAARSLAGSPRRRWPIPTIDLTTPPDDLWQRMRNGFGMPDLDSPLVADRQAWYLNRPTC
jgi:hypothetical protein